MATSQQAKRHSGPIPGPKEDTPEWLVMTNPKTGGVIFGASDAAAACGRSHYKTALDVYMDRTGTSANYETPEQVQKRLRRGRRIQPVILAEYSEETGANVVEPLRRFYHPTKPFMSCTPDGIAILDGNRYGVECKGTTERMYAAMTALDENKYGKDGTDLVPDDVLFQAQQQMDVMDWDKVDVVVFFGLFTMRIYPIQRSDAIINAITSAEKELAERIENRDPPEPDWSHGNTKQILSEMYGCQEGKKVFFTREDEVLWEDYKYAGESIRRLEKEKEELRNRLLGKLEDAEIAVLPDYTREVRRSRVSETYYTEEDAVKARAKIGKVKRRGYDVLRERKCK